MTRIDPSEGRPGIVSRIGEAVSRRRGLALGAPGLWLAWTLACVGGCGRDFYARRLVEHSRTPGKIRLAMLPSPGELLCRGRIDARRWIHADDGTPIDVWVIRGRTRRTPSATVLLLHGLWDSKARMYRMGQRLADAGFDVVLPDLRAHGSSGGVYSTFGARDVADLQTVMASLSDEGLLSGDRYVVGFSMGGGVAVQYGAADPHCHGVIALAPVASARRIMRRMLRFLCPWTSESEAQATIDRAGEIADIDIDAASAVTAAARLRCPLVIAHGTCDLTVPLAHGKAIAAAADGAELTVVPVRGHTTLLVRRNEWVLEQLERFAAEPESLPAE